MTREKLPAPHPDLQYAGKLEELRAKGMMVVRGGVCPLLVVAQGERVFAVDNRCPHLGFPLHRGSVEDGIVTCHWHHARFDLASGGGFDPWADDLATAEVRIVDGAVWVGREARFRDGERHWRNRLSTGLEQNLGLVIAKAILGRRAEGASAAELIREAALFGARQRDGWDTGLTVLTALGNLAPALAEAELYLALYKGIARVAEDCAGAPARRRRLPLEGPAPQAATLTRWLCHWTAVRHREGAERTLLTAIAGGAGEAGLAAMMLAAVTDRVFADGGHALDFINKSFECLDLIGWQHAAELLPTTIGLLVEARGAEESNAWRHPIDLIALAAEAAARLPARCEGRGRRPDAEIEALAEAMLGDEPRAIVDALVAALAGAMPPAEAARALAYAAALRVARFGTANEHADWESAHHAMTYANALQRHLARLERAGQPVEAAALRGLVHGALRLYLLRFLNVPPAKLPGEAGAMPQAEPGSAPALGARLLAALDRHAADIEAAEPIARLVASGNDPAALEALLARAVLREDAGFHAYQMLEAGIVQSRLWSEPAPRRRILVAVARYLAAHFPTARADLQTATVAEKLARGLALHGTDEAEG
jgi:nitrite reductase/ring-hydroxylating ferredoxin subunit